MAVDRLGRGDGVQSVARWLMTQNRGPPGTLSRYTLERYLYVLADNVKEQKALHPAPKLDQVMTEVPVQVKPMQGIAKFKTVEDFVADRCEIFNRQFFAAGVVISCWEAMERLRWAEEILVKNPENAMPLHSMMSDRFFPKSPDDPCSLLFRCNRRAGLLLGNTQRRDVTFRCAASM